MSTKRWWQKSPQSLSGISTHPNMVRDRSMSSSWMDESNLLRIMSTGPPILEIRLFQTLTLKIQGQGHGCGKRARSCSQSSIWLTHFFVIKINQTNNSWDKAISKFDREKSKAMVMGEVKRQGHTVYPVSNRCTSFSFHINQTNHSSDADNRVFDHEKNTSKILKKICQK